MRIIEREVVLRKFAELDIDQVFKQFPVDEFIENGYYIKVSDEMCYNFQRKELQGYRSLTVYKSLIAVDAELYITGN